MEEPRFSLSPSLNRDKKRKGGTHSGTLEPAEFIGLVSKKNQDSLCLCYETSPLRESQLNRSTAPKDSEFTVQIHLPLVFFLPPSLPFSPLLSIALVLTKLLTVLTFNSLSCASSFAKLNRASYLETRYDISTSKLISSQSAFYTPGFYQGGRRW